MTRPSAVGEAVEGPSKPARQKLLEAATDLFYRRGIRDVGIEEIIAAAGVTKMSLYRSFHSKDALVAACLAARDVGYWDRWDGVLARHPGDPRAQLRDIFAGLARLTTRDSWRGCPFTNAATEFPEPDHPGRRVAEANKRELHRRLGELARAIGARDPAMLADHLTLLFEGAYVSPQVFGPSGPSSHVAEAAEALVEAQLRG